MISLSLKHQLFLLAGGLLLSAAVLWMATQNPTHHALQRSAETTAVHGNSDHNGRPHIVYEIYAIPPGGTPITLKYGISSQYDFVTKPGNPRPEYQVPLIKLRPRFRNMAVHYKILHRNIPNRLEAKKIERYYVNKYYQEHGIRLRLQKRPLPEMLKK